MARVTLDIPAELPFSCKLRVRITDLNYAGHLSNDKVLALMHEARAQFFAHLGWEEMNADGASFIMADCAIVYRSEGFFNQNLICEVGGYDFARASFDLLYRLCHADVETGKAGKVLAEGKTGMVCFDYEERKVKSIPLHVRARLGDPAMAAHNTFKTDHS